MTSLSLLAAERSCSADSLLNEAYRYNDPETVSRFLSTNNFGSVTDRIGRGELYAVPAGPSWRPMNEAEMAKQLKRSNYAIRHQPTEPAAEEFNRNFVWLNDLLGEDSVLPAIGKVGEGTAEYFEKRTSEIAKTFRNLESNYRTSLSMGGDFSKGASSSARSFIMRDLDSQLTGISRRMFLERPHRTDIKASMNLSHKSMRNSVKTGGRVKDIEKIAAVGEKATRAASHLRRLGYIGKVLTFGESMNNINQAYETRGDRAGRMQIGSEISKTGASVAGGALGGAALGWAGAAAAVAFGVGTGGLGFVALAIGGAVVGSVIGGGAGEIAGEQIWDSFGDDVYAFGEDLFSTSQKKPVQ
ncbi:MAG TPA: hypothetical protein PKD99_12620 [Sphingopyxis sp.]|nr:hypothetical protein [Sphingopyxis sp.]HMP45942.1 hypothetical protein [Sphingopyxis sp.]HMQ18312.1 hypothetical protein [Sphingopyxis sp.]